ncbi:MAG TPA: hypothetical protein DEQ61_15120, partial [Streptomyces sp.]|nr:hypothetical protein [Streptomyces sp.]
MTPPRSRKPRARTYDPVRTRDALEAEVKAVREAVRVMCAAPDAPELLLAPSGLPGWTVRDLVAHLAVGLDALPRRLAEQGGRPA